MDTVLDSSASTEAVKNATRDLIRSTLEENFHIDDRTLDLLDIPPEQDATWKRQIDSVHDKFHVDQAANIDTLLALEGYHYDSSEAEAGLCNHLQDILTWIAATGVKGPKRDCVGPNFNRKPDLILIETPVQANLGDIAHPYWRQVSAIVKVKADRDDGPNQILLNDAVLETIDHMQMHLSMRPFQRWVFGLLVCGTDFYPLYLDRAGGAITQRKSLVTDSRTFIQVILHMTKYMTRQQFGQDPDVFFGDTYDRHEESWKPTYPWDIKMPVYSFPGFSAGPRVQTIDVPIFINHGLLGRGTSVWKVYPERNIEAPHQIMKYSWRSLNRRSESDIYVYIQSAFPDGIDGICKFVDGNDVAWNSAFQPIIPNQLGKEPVVNPRRKSLLNQLTTDQVRVVHRLLLDTRGEPLSSFQDSDHLRKVLTSASSAHKLLVDKGILHGDIRAGNILIQDSASHPSVLVDVMSAEILDTAVNPRLLDIRRAQSAAQKPQPGITATTHFAAWEMLNAIIFAESGQFTAAVRHDLESFCWVTLWAIIRKPLSRPVDLPPHLFQKWEEHAEFRRNLFQRLSGPYNTVYQRCAVRPLAPGPRQEITLLP